MLKDKQGMRVNVLSESIILDRYCASRINIESQIHTHDFYEFAICVDGEFINLYNNSEEILIEKGSFFLARPGEIHKINQKQGSSFIRDDLYVTKKKMKKLCAAISNLSLISE